MGRGDTLPVQDLGDLDEGLAFCEQRPDLLPPFIVPLVAIDVGKSNVLGAEVPAGRLEDRVVVGRGGPLGAWRRDLIELAAPLAASTGERSGGGLCHGLCVRSRSLGIQSP